MERRTPSSCRQNKGPLWCQPGNRARPDGAATMHITRLCFVVVVAVCLCGCASSRSTVSTKSVGADAPSVRKVDYSRTPEMKELAEHARQLGDEMYPRVLALLADDAAKLPQQFDIVFNKRTWRGMGGVTLGARVRLNAGWLANNPASLDAILIHEMAHVA